MYAENIVYLLCACALISIPSYGECSKKEMEDTICSLCNQRKSCSERGPSRSVVAFTAYPSKDQSVNSGKKLLLDSLISNIGGGFNTSSGTFTAPKNGSYFFSWNFLKYTGKSFSIDLIVNGKSMVHSYANQSGFVSLVGSSVVELKRGDKVWFAGSHGAANVHGNEFTTINGILL